MKKTLLILAALLCCCFALKAQSIAYEPIMSIPSPIDPDAVYYLGYQDGQDFYLHTSGTTAGQMQLSKNPENPVEYKFTNFGLGVSVHSGETNDTYLHIDTQGVSYGSFNPFGTTAPFSLSIQDGDISSAAASGYTVCHDENNIITTHTGTSEGNLRFFSANGIIKPLYHIAVSATPEELGTATATCGGEPVESALEGTSITVTAAPAEGCLFTGWTENSAQVSTDNPYTFTLTSDRNLVANFTFDEDPKNNIAVIQPEGCTIYVNPSMNVYYLQNVQLTYELVDGFYFVEWVVKDGETPIQVNNGWFTMPNSPNVTVTATVELLEYHIVCLDDDIVGGHISTGGVSTAYPNETVHLSSYPAPGYGFFSWTVTAECGTVEINNNSFIMPNCNVTVSATFLPAITVYDGTNTHKYTAVLTFFGDTWNSAAQFIVPAEQLVAMAGGTINSMKFYVDSHNIILLGNLGYPTYAGYITEGDYETPLSSFIFDDVDNIPTNMFNGHVSLTNGNSQLIIDFVEPYAYNGGDLAIAFKCTENSDYTSLSYYGKSVTNGGIYRSTSTGSTPNDFVPKTTFYYTPGEVVYYDIKMHANGVMTTEHLRKGSTLEAPENIPAGLAFCGWTTADIATYTDEAPDYVTKAIDVTDLYAVFSYAENEAVYYMTEAITDGTVAESTSTKNIIITGTNSVNVANGARLEMAQGGLFRNGNAAKFVFADGAQFYYTGTETVTATFQKAINGYTDYNDNYYFIANPTANPTVANLTSNNFDLYTFDGAQEDEWRNAKENENFEVEREIGYLYANSSDVTLEFAGEIIPAASADAVLNYADKDFGGFNLIGNPYACKAYVSGYCFYKIDGNEVKVSTDNFIEPCEAVFVEATATGQSVNLSTEEPEAPASMMSISVGQNRGEAIDRAIVSFDGANDMHKFMMNPAHTNIRLAKNGEEFAVVSTSSASGEIPVSFKAAKNGSYTIMVNVENVDLNYLHLVDNLTGNDVDLLGSEGDVARNVSTYTFDAKTSDYASRFKLVFGVNGDAASAGLAGDFAYISNGEIIVSNEGRATLQVIDVMGRIVSSEEINGECRISTNGLTAGVYVLNLNGMTQKIVVR